MRWWPCSATLQLLHRPNPQRAAARAAIAVLCRKLTWLSCDKSRSSHPGETCETTGLLGTVILEVEIHGQLCSSWGPRNEVCWFWKPWTEQGSSYMGVSTNGGTLKWMVSYGTSYWNGWFAGYRHDFGNLHSGDQVNSTWWHGGSQLFSLDVSGHSVENMVGVTCNVGPPR